MASHLPSTASLVLVHGSWHSPQHFEPIAQDLRNHDYKCIPVALPSTQTPDTPPAGLADDIAAVRAAVTQELELGNNVVVVAHSFGGFVANAALEGLDHDSRRAANEPTFVKAVAFIAAMPAPAGSSFMDILGGKPHQIHDLRVPEFCWVGPPGPEHYFYNEMAPEEAKHWASLLRQQSWRAYTDRTSCASYIDIPCVYLRCTKDQAFPHEAQTALIQSHIDVGGKLKLETCEGDHSPFLGKLMSETSLFIQKAAKQQA